MPDLTLEKLNGCISDLWYEPSRQEILEHEKSARRWEEYHCLNEKERIAWWDNVELKYICQKRLDFYWSRKLGLT